MEVKVFKYSDGIEDCLKLRQIIFIEWQKVPYERERDGKDDVAIHFLLQDKNAPIGVARIIFQDENPIIERLGILKTYRKNDAGTILMKYILNYCKIKNHKKAKLSSQEHAVSFYQKLGFKIISERYFDANIPHFKMEIEF